MMNTLTLKILSVKIMMPNGRSGKVFSQNVSQADLYILNAAISENDKRLPLQNWNVRKQQNPMGQLVNF